jgi:hypothetical protein
MFTEHQWTHEVIVRPCRICTDGLFMLASDTQLPLCAACDARLAAMPYGIRVSMERTHAKERAR